MYFREKAGYYLFIYLVVVSYWNMRSPGQVVELEQDFPGQDALRELQGSKYQSKCVRLWILTRQDCELKNILKPIVVMGNLFQYTVSLFINLQWWEYTIVLCGKSAVLESHCTYPLSGPSDPEPLGEASKVMMFELASWSLHGRI